MQHQDRSFPDGLLVIDYGHNASRVDTPTDDAAAVCGIHGALMNACWHEGREPGAGAADGGERQRKCV